MYIAIVLYVFLGKKLSGNTHLYIHVRKERKKEQFFRRPSALPSTPINACFLDALFLRRCLFLFNTNSGAITPPTYGLFFSFLSRLRMENAGGQWKNGIRETYSSHHSSLFLSFSSFTPNFSLLSLRTHGAFLWPLSLSFSPNVLLLSLPQKIGKSGKFSFSLLLPFSLSLSMQKP